MGSKPDDLDAVRTVVDALKPFDVAEQQRILRWATEKLGIQVAEPAPQPPQLPQLPEPATDDTETPVAPEGRRSDIKSFVASKMPSSNNEFAATVAYFYRFEAGNTEAKSSITADDLQEACRLAGRSRLTIPGQTLINAHTVGLLDKTGERGAYSISTVGENLVAMALPSSGHRQSSSANKKKKTTKKKKTKVTQKKPGSRKS